MPYIDEQSRTELDVHVKKLNVDHAGKLNYIITRLCLLHAHGPDNLRTDPPNYEKWNEIMGVLSCAQQEMYRRGVAPYEDTKIKSNGDVFPDKRDES